MTSGFCNKTGWKNKTRLFPFTSEKAGSAILAAVTAIIHIMDEISWGLLPETAGRNAVRIYLKGIPELCGLTPDEDLNSILQNEDPVKELLQKTLAWIIKRRIPV